MNIITSSINCGIYYAANKNIFIPIASGSAYGEITSTNLQENTTYIVNVVKQRDGNVVSTLKDANGQLIKQQTKNIGEVSLSYSTHKLGTSASLAFSGSIDLNNTYIKVNGITWFNGKQTASTTVNDVYLNHNVGYTIIGSPTITDGVVSGFSSSDRLKLTPALVFATNDNIEYNFVFTTGQSIGTEWLFGYLTDSLWSGIYITSTKVNVPFTRYNDTNYYCSVDYSLQTSTTYRINVKRINGTVTSTLYDSSNTLLASNTNNIPYEVSSANNTIGTNPSYSYGGAFTGSIDFNNTYIKANGVTLFNGKQTASPTVNEVYYNKNCGYTIVGSPTINNGVASGFSSDDYILLPSVPTKSISELIIKIKLNSFALGQNVYTNFLRGPSSFQGYTYCGTNAFNYTGFNIAGLGDLRINHNLQSDTDYWIKYTNDGTNCTAWWSEDGVNYTVGNIKESSLITDNNSGTIRVGSRSDRLAFPGNIDLNNTYIKVNDVTWFNGKETANTTPVWTRSV